MRPLVIDSFAGGGGASEGIRAALGRDPDFALNHDRIALAMHRINHPDTHHIEEDVWNVDPIGMCAGRPVGLLWMSPDCKHFSKAKGGKPREKAIRGLAWVGVKWVKSLPKWQRPRVVILENVEEFADWGPLLEDGRPCPIQRGATFREYLRAWEAIGGKAEHRELRACDYGSPTIRKRLFLVIRFDSKPIAWPESTHGDPKSEAVRSGRLKPWRTAAEIIDWSLPCPSIFETSAEIKARFGIRANRPLADATIARIAKGTMRYVVSAAKPFVVGDFLGSRRESNPSRPGVKPDPAHLAPAPQKSGFGDQQRDAQECVSPFITKFNKGSTGHGIDEPIHTITTAHSDTHPGGYAPMGIVAPHLIRVDQTSGDPARKGVHAADAPMSTITTAGAQAIVAPFLTPRFQEKPGHKPRVRSVEEPTATITGGDNVPGHLVGAYLVPRYGGRPGQDPRARAIDEHAPVIVPTGNEGSLAAVSMIRHFGASVGSTVDEPVGTITAGGDGKAGVVAAFLAQHNTERGGAVKPGTDVREPVSTITSGGGHQTLVATHMLNLRGSDRRGGPVDAPAPTVTGGGNHAAAVYAFLAKYYGEGLPSQAADEPLHTVTAKPRHGVVTVTVEGQPFVIVDIGMRMLTPRERFAAQGFRSDYVIDRGELEDGSVIGLTLEQQGRACGNSVCPQIAEALVRANYSDAEARPSLPIAPADMPLFPSVAAE